MTRNRFLVVLALLLAFEWRRGWNELELAREYGLRALFFTLEHPPQAALRLLAVLVALWVLIRVLDGFVTHVVDPVSFRVYFGVWPEAGKHKSVVQTIVDRRMRAVAMDLKALFADEQGLQQNYREDPETSLASLKKLERQINKAKSAFSLGADLAKRFDYSVYSWEKYWPK